MTKTNEDLEEDKDIKNVEDFSSFAFDDRFCLIIRFIFH